MFKQISPDQIQAGDILHCYKHDDQWEARSARVEMVAIEDTAGVLTFPKWKYPGAEPEMVVYPYKYRVRLVMRHVNLNRLDARGGEPFTWGFFPWNSVYRYEPEKEMAPDGNSTLGEGEEAKNH